MGDGALVARRRSGHGRPFPLGPRRQAQAEYGDWKASLFANLTVSRSTNAKGAVFHDVAAAWPELARAPPSGVRRWPEAPERGLPQGAYAAVLGPLVHGRRWLHPPDRGQAQRTQGWQRPVGDLRAGHDGRHAQRPAWSRTWPTPGASRPSSPSGAPAEMCRSGVPRRRRRPSSTPSSLPYIHPSMQNKLLPEYQGRFAVEPVFAPERQELLPMPVLDIHRKPCVEEDPSLRHRGRGQPQLLRGRA